MREELKIKGKTIVIVGKRILYGNRLGDFVDFLRIYEENPEKGLVYALGLSTKPIGNIA